METFRNIQNPIPPVLLQPSKWLSIYEDFVTKNASSVGQVESALRSLTYIIPGEMLFDLTLQLLKKLTNTFYQGDTASQRYPQNVYTPVCSCYRYTMTLSFRELLIGFRQLSPGRRPLPTPGIPNTGPSRSSLYRQVALALQMLQYTELLWEMAARRRGQKTRWRVVIFIEFAKAVCRLLLLRLTNSRPLVSPPLPEREVDPRTTEEEEPQRDWNGMDTPVSDRSSDLSWTMPRTGLSLPSLPDVNDVSNYLISKVLTADDIKPPKALLHRATGQGQLAEVLYILRPVVYAMAMQKWRGDKRSWRPWLIGFGMEYGCRQLAKRDFRERVAGGLRGLTGLEREELKKRGWSMGWWMMRGAFYENITKSWLHSLTGKMKGKPLLDLVGSVVEDYEYLWDNFYFSTATL
ncbi:peroxin Pex16-Penicillium chrysogenum [Penicillium mononematosum]|uniref:peroxin Pex16-Penicillium chrysogenum n=1 Tax=Penicillium mononematosum TaxID=268346 RepID=UPI00254755B7|nr:peroxin Pex16-Penicillium chrysogenum [Penicillium mononematosum]KAJ6186322.1 peroxin Pex16-Penicillium chrysogenum [Penicillium mononematosum]